MTHQTSMPTSSSSSSTPAQLTAGYAQLQGFDAALLDAERRLKVAHHDFTRQQGPRPDSVYREVLRLREQSRLLLQQLADLFLREEHRLPRPVTGTPSRR